VLHRDTVYPNRQIARVNLGMDWLTFFAIVDASGCEPESLHKEIVCGWDIFVDQ